MVLSYQINDADARSARHGHRRKTDAATVATTIAAVTTVAAVETGTVAIGTVTTLGAFVALLHLDGGAIFVCVDLDGHHTHDVVMQTGQTFHFLNGRRRSVGAQEGVVALAVLVDLVGHGLHAPVFGFDDLAAVVRKYRGEVFHQAFGLRVGQVLTRNEDMLV